MNDDPTQDARQLVASFVVAGEPISKSRARFTKRGSKTVAYTPQKTLDGERAIAAAFLSESRKRGVDTEAAFAVQAHFYSGTRQRRDVDNMAKLILDGLNGVAWPDDNQVLDLHVRKSFVTKAEARTEVQIFLIGDMDFPKQPCIRCGTEFRTYDSWVNDPKAKKYCTYQCFNEHVREKSARDCAHCGTPYQAAKGTSPSKYCSRDCAYEARRTVAKCAICEVEFSIQDCHLKERNYCSDQCRREQDRQSHKDRRSKYFPGTCLICGSGTTRKEYKRCNPCKLVGAVGKPQGQPGELEARKPKVCAEGDCNEVARTKGMCGKHYMRQRRKEAN